MSVFLALRILNFMIRKWPQISSFKNPYHILLCFLRFKNKYDVFYPNGAIYAAHTNWIEQNDSFYKKEALGSRIVHSI